MKILVVGGTGMIGGHAALHLTSLGHDVAVAGRRPPQETTELAKLPFVQGDFMEGTFTKEQLAPFDAVVFAAGNDIRHLPKGTKFDDHVMRSNAECVPQFAALCKEAGVRHFIHVGSFYPHIAPELMDKIPYIRSRKLAVEGIVALADDNFHAVSLDAPFVVGTVPGMSLPMFEMYTRYAEGKLEGMEAFGPAGGTNFISCQSLSEAIAGALERGENGKAYLLGDENLGFAEYFGLFFKAAGNDVPVPALDKEHPMLPDIGIYTGRGNYVTYEPDPADVELLGYRRHDVTRAVNEVVDQYRSRA
ncbi:MAG: NAD(P)-dependent oxidoreductase [Novosphingobium sp.]|nr:NAD(P)-dependent oxidoreductase [Novosphingobium sp.]